jgi:benzylsuccinate CoA-transferase BbsE subunit
MEDDKALLLDEYRILDLTDEKGYLCGKILGDLGADVIKVEPPGGDPGRNIGPFYKDILDREKSLTWFAFNANKRGITLNIETTDGQAIFRRLISKTDLIIESFSPGYLDTLGIGYGKLSRIHPEIVMTSITPFGQTGPYREFKGPDIVVMAMGGVMYIWGDPDRPPVRLSVDQAYYHASADAAVGSIIALYHKEISGEGQQVDVSAQDSVTNALIDSLPHWDIGKVINKRMGSSWISASKGGAVTRQTWVCRDGFITFEVLGGMAGAGTNRAMVDWALSEGMRDESMERMVWEEFSYDTATQEEHNHIIDFFARFFMNHTRKELFQGAVERRIILYPVSDSRDIAEDEHLEARDFWQHVQHPELGTKLPYLGGFVKSPGVGLGIRRRAPLIGEHNGEIYKGELNISDEEMLIMKQNNII